MKLVMDNGDSYKLVPVNHGAYVSMIKDINFDFLETKTPDILDPVTREKVILGTALYQYNCITIDRQYYCLIKIDK